MTEKRRRAKISSSNKLKRVARQKNNDERLVVAALSSKSDEFVKKKLGERSELEMVSMNNSFGFRLSLGNFHEAKTVHQVYIFISKNFIFIIL